MNNKLHVERLHHELTLLIEGYTKAHEERDDYGVDFFYDLIRQKALRLKELDTENVSGIQNVCFEQGE